MLLHLIAVPFDSGRRSWRMGAGPEHLLHRLKPRLPGCTVEVLETDDFAAIENAVRRAVDSESFPVILAGNCMTTLPALRAIGGQPALLWLDAHADFNTPQTSPSGFLDGMALSMITGRCHHERILPDDHIMMLGVRSIDEGEKEPLSHVRVIRSSRELWSALAAIPGEQLYFHCDLDALDPSELVANSFATARGLSLHTVYDAIEAVKENKRIAALAFTAYEPEADAANRGADVVYEIIARVTARKS